MRRTPSSRRRRGGRGAGPGRGVERGPARACEIGGLPVRVDQRVDLLPPDSALDPAEVGRAVAAIHCTPFLGERPEDPWYTDPVGTPAWDALADDLAAAGVSFASDLGAMARRVRRAGGADAALADLRTCHRDLWADNIRPAVSGGLCVIDWENCGLADPGQEVARVLFEFGYGDPDRAGAVYRAYRRAGGPGHRPVTVGLLDDSSPSWGTSPRWLRRIWLDPGTTEAERRRQEARVAEAVERPLTIAVIESCSMPSAEPRESASAFRRPTTHGSCPIGGVRVRSGIRSS